MKVRHFTLSLLFTFVSFAVMAQDAPAQRSLTPKDKWEVGLDLGLPFVAGDIDSKLGFGGGLHVRKALDHVFSIRGNVFLAATKNEEENNNITQSSDMNYFGGGVSVVTAINNIRFDKPNRKLLLNAIVGVGYHSFKTEYSNIAQIGTTIISGESDRRNNAYVELGAGIAYRVSPKFNIGLTHTVHSAFGRTADLLDSDQNVDRSVTTYRDILHIPHLSLNFNIGGKKSADGMAASEPLYWANPLAATAQAIADLEARPVYDPTDTDGDGVIDAIDDEDNSPAGAKVNTKGVTLDSDGDKVADYKDKEPFSPPGYAVNADGVAQGLPKYTTEKQVNDIVDAKIAAIKFPEPKTNDWFFPMVNFNDNSYALRYSEYEKLYQVATVLKQNPGIKVVAVGNTDDRSSEKYNNVLSYNRAKAAIDFIVSNYGIDRSRFILNWAGEGSKLVPVKGSNLANRRVEFRVAKGETEMGRPEGPEAGKGGKANTNSGY
jgi:OmpA-OmpF porin, OOP family